MSLLLRAILPIRCLYCGEPAKRVCANCAGLVGASPRLVIRRDLIGFAADEYSEAAKLILRSYKELGESSLASLLAARMRPLLASFPSIPSLLVPIPSNRESLLERGFNPAELLARELSASVPGLTWRNLLTRKRKTLDQSKLAPAARASNQLGSMVAPAGNLNVLLIDDVVTTGATLLEAASTLQMAGHFVHGFLTFAETEAKKV